MLVLSRLTCIHREGVLAKVSFGDLVDEHTGVHLVRPSR